MYLKEAIMKILKDKNFYLSLFFAIILFVALYPISATPIAYYVLVFIAISITGFAMVLYRFLSKSFTLSNSENLLWIITLSALPHLVFSLLNYGSWVCLGGAIFTNIVLLFKKNKFLK